jgi:hypothetical protein
MPEQEVGEVLTVFGERVNHEHELIAHRMSWLMALNGFLVAAIGITIANSSRIPHSTLNLIVVGVSCLGAISNASCLFSNYWASRAISETAIALHTVLNAPEYRETKTRSWRSLRLYGRDPDNPPLPPSFWRPPTKFLHPWHLLPIIFGLTYLLVPISGLNRTIAIHRGSGQSGATDILLAILPTLLTALIFLPPILIERTWRRAQKAHRKAEYIWNDELPNREEYDEIFPLVSQLGYKKLMAILKCSRGEAMAIVRGDFVPHERNWVVLKEATRDNMAGNSDPGKKGGE